jgi:hypothetical protein
MAYIFYEICISEYLLLIVSSGRSDFANHCHGARPRLIAMNRLSQAFTAHPRSVGENYFQHMGAALSFAGLLLLAGAASLVHSVFPFLLVGTGSRMVSRLHDRMATNRVKAIRPR